MTVSVIIPVYNSKDTIVRALNSCIGQVMKEVIVVDNNSDDSSIELAEKFIDRLPLKIIKEKKPGASAARNKGLKLAVSEFIQFLDADDELLEGKLEKQLKLIENENCDVVAGAYKINRENDISNIRISGDSIVLSLFKGQLGITSANLFRKSALESVGGWDETLKSSQEADLMFRMWCHKSKFGVDNRLLTIIHQNRIGRISSTNLESNAEAFVDLRKSMLKSIQLLAPHDYQSKKSQFAASFLDSLLALYKFNKKKAAEKTRFYFLFFLRNLPLTKSLKLIQMLLWL